MELTFKKLISFGTLSVLIGSNAFAQNTSPPPFEQGYGLSSEKYPAAYNPTARFDRLNSWDVFVTGSLLYWIPNQDAMEIASFNTISNGIGNPQIPLVAESLVQSSEFKPGFTIGMGVHFGFDKWVGYLEYTQFHQHCMTSAYPSDYRANTDTPVWQIVDWFTASAAAPFTLAQSADSKWRTKIDLLDATLSRPYYLGSQLTITPFSGLRAAWIRQNFRLEIEEVDITVVPVAWNPIVSRNRSNSWAVGPRAGCNARWLIRSGLRFEGDIGASLLYTRFTRVAHSEDSSTVLGQTLSTRLINFNTVRPMADMKIGMGWGSYFDGQNYHIDLLVAYDFNIMWRQNMMRSLVSTTYINTTGPAGDLTLQGASLQARIDF